jgi:ubiquinone biosynthesis protein UbiJ
MPRAKQVPQTETEIHMSKIIPDIIAEIRQFVPGVPALMEYDELIALADAHDRLKEANLALSETLRAPDLIRDRLEKERNEARFERDRLKAALISLTTANTVAIEERDAARSEAAGHKEIDAVFQREVDQLREERDRLKAELERLRPAER